LESIGIGDWNILKQNCNTCDLCVRWILMNLGDRSRFKPVTFAHQEVLQAWLQWFVHGCSIHAVTSEESRNHGQGKCRQIWLSIWLQVFHFGGCQFVIRSHDRHAHTSAKCIWRAWSIWKSAVILRVRRLQIVLVWKFRSFHFLVAECCWCLCRSNVSDFCLSGCCQEAQERAEFRLSRSYAGRPPCCFWTSESYTERDWDIVGPCWTYCWWSFYVFLCLSVSCQWVFLVWPLLSGVQDSHIPLIESIWTHQVIQIDVLAPTGATGRAMTQTLHHMTRMNGIVCYLDFHVQCHVADLRI
jgi:hypothetical protein